MATGKKRSASSKAYFTAYQTTGKHAKNQAAKRARHLKAHPNDVQSATKAIAGYKRQKPMKRNATTPNTRFSRTGEYKLNDAGVLMLVGSGFKTPWPSTTFREQV